MPAEEQRSGGMRSGAHEGLMCPLEKGVRGIDICASEEEKEFSSSLGFHYISRLAAANIGCAS